MANDQLSTGASSGEQTNTGSPQSVPSANNLGGQTATKLQSSPSSLQGGTQLENNPSLSNITLAPTQSSSDNSSTGQAAIVTPIKHHHINPVMLGFPIVLVIFAVLTFWTINRSAKTTTEYL